MIEVCIEKNTFLAGFDKCTVVSLILELINGQFTIKLSGCDNNHNSHIWFNRELKVGDEVFVKIKNPNIPSSPTEVLAYDQIYNSSTKGQAHNSSLYFLELEQVLKSKGLL